MFTPVKVLITGSFLSVQKGDPGPNRQNAANHRYPKTPQRLKLHLTLRASQNLQKICLLARPPLRPEGKVRPSRGDHIGRDLYMVPEQRKECHQDAGKHCNARDLPRHFRFRCILAFNNICPTAVLPGRRFVFHLSV